MLESTGDYPVIESHVVYERHQAQYESLKCRQISFLNLLFSKLRCALQRTFYQKLKRCAKRNAQLLRLIESQAFRRACLPFFTRWSTCARQRRREQQVLARSVLHLEKYRGVFCRKHMEFGFRSIKQLSDERRLRHKIVQYRFKYMSSSRELKLALVRLVLKYRILKPMTHFFSMWKMKQKVTYMAQLQFQLKAKQLQHQFHQISASMSRQLK